jgi:hypothetical protein
MNCMENLPNETFYEIFDYFDACEIYHAFSNLNNRFQSLFNSSLIRLKMNYNCSEAKEIFMHNY